MLVLSRKPGEAITIVTPSGDRVRIIVVRANEARLRIGIEAEPNYQIWRDEILPEHLKEDGN